MTRTGGDPVRLKAIDPTGSPFLEEEKLASDRGGRWRSTREQKGRVQCRRGMASVLNRSTSPSHREQPVRGVVVINGKANLCLPVHGDALPRWAAGKWFLTCYQRHKKEVTMKFSMKLALSLTTCGLALMSVSQSAKATCSAEPYTGRSVIPRQPIALRIIWI